MQNVRLLWIVLPVSSSGAQTMSPFGIPVPRTCSMEPRGAGMETGYSKLGDSGPESRRQGIPSGPVGNHIATARASEEQP